MEMETMAMLANDKRPLWAESNDRNFAKKGRDFL